MINAPSILHLLSRVLTNIYGPEQLSRNHYTSWAQLQPSIVWPLELACRAWCETAAPMERKILQVLNLIASEYSRLKPWSAVMSSPAIDAEYELICFERYEHDLRTEATHMAFALK